MMGHHETGQRIDFTHPISRLPYLWDNDYAGTTFSIAVPTEYVLAA